jgi:hypothetical protein
VQRGGDVSTGFARGVQEPPQVIVQHATKRGHDTSAGFGRGFGETLGKKFAGLIWFIIIAVVIIAIIANL